MAKLITPFCGKKPSIHSEAFVDRSARIIGDVTLEEGVNVWPMAVIRADSSPVHIGRNAAVLDHSLVEAPEGYPVFIDEEALVSHRVVIHGAHVQERALVGIGAIVLDGAVISSGSIVAAGSLVAPGTKIPPNSLIMGIPGKVIRETTEGERDFILAQVRGLVIKSRKYKIRGGRGARDTRR
jgi:carbonic anhydrase/acetyltransferase-like protein (isoleucine patch superfamily)